MRIVTYILLLFAVMASCQSPKEKAKDEEKFQWNAGISAPKNYIATPFVEYFYKGKSITGTSANVGINPGWGINSGGYTGGDKFKPVPDSVTVKWRCGFDLIEYEGGSKLPRKKMLDLFNQGTINPYNGKKDDYTVLVAGTAPGGNVAIWMKAGQVITEVSKFKAKKVGQEDRYAPHTVTLWTSTGQEAKDILTYISLHGIPYKVWETGEKEYDYDIGFSSEDISKRKIRMAITGYSKDGSLVYATENLQYIPWSGNYKIPMNKLNKKLPLELFIQWISSDQQQWYQSKIVLPNNFHKQFLSFQKVYGNETLLVIGMNKIKTENMNYTFGKVWLQGPNNKKEIMSFRASKLDIKTRKFLVSQYSLPKGFEFPKWEGREPLKTPDLEYWQEK